MIQICSSCSTDTQQQTHLYHTQLQTEQYRNYFLLCSCDPCWSGLGLGPRLGQGRFYDAACSRLRFSCYSRCCSPLASASAAAPRLRPLLPGPDGVRFKCCSASTSCCFPAHAQYSRTFFAEFEVHIEVRRLRVPRPTNMTYHFRTHTLNLDIQTRRDCTALPP